MVLVLSIRRDGTSIVFTFIYIYLLYTFKRSPYLFKIRNNLQLLSMGKKLQMLVRESPIKKI